MAVPDTRLSDRTGPSSLPQAGDGPQAARAVEPVAQLIAMHIVVLGIAMLAPFAIDLNDDDGNAEGMLLSALLTIAAGAALWLLTRQPRAGGLARPQAFMLTAAVWTILPIFGALPFVFGAPSAGYADAYFESISGMTTTGSTVFSGLDAMPRGALLWRAMLQWFGGLGIVIVGISFLPAMRVGGMQFFHAVSMDVSGDIIPQATRIAADLLFLYLGLTFLCSLAYSVAGMTAFDAICHAMTTISTGGYANYDASFGVFGPAAQYVATLFMALAAMPFIRFIELSRGSPRPLWGDTQIRTFLGIVLAASAMVAAAEIRLQGEDVEPAIRSALFTITSIITTTGYATTDYSRWGSLAVAVIFIVSLIGGCSGSTAGGAKVFRFQILFSALRLQISRILNPHGVFQLRYQSRPVPPDIVSSIIAFFFVYLVTLGVVAILLSLMGVDFVTALTAPVATVTNVGPGLGPVIGPAGNFAPLPDAAKLVLSLAMLLGRLEFMTVLVMLSPAFWR